MEPSQKREAFVRNWLAGLPAETIWYLRAAASREWNLVRRWPGISGQDKLAWLFLWAASECGGGLVDVSATMIAEDQGVSGDAGNDRLTNLLRNGLVRFKDRDEVRGRWRLELLDYADLRQHPKARRIRWDGQKALFETESEEVPDDVEPQPCVAGLAAGGTRGPWPVVSLPERPSGGTPGGSSGGTSEGRNHDHENHDLIALSETIPHNHAPISHENHETMNGGGAREGKSKGVDRAGGTSGGSSARLADTVKDREPQDDRMHAGSLFARIAGGIRGEVDQLVAAHELQAAILGRVGDPDLNRDVVLRLCMHVVTGRIELDAIADLLGDLERRREQGQLRSSPGAYFMGGMKRIFKQADCVR